jgi:hypothetical protein
MSLSSFSSIGNLAKYKRASGGGAAAAGESTISSTSLVYYYPFESADVSGSTYKNGITGGTYNLTLAGTPVQTGTKINGAGALETSVSKFAYLTTPTNYYSTTQSFCFKFRVTAISGYVALLHSLWGSSGNNLNFMIQIYNNTAPYVVRGVFNNPSYGEIAISSSIAANTWYSLAVVKNGSSIQCYLNGASSGSSGTNFLTTANQVNRLYIGTDHTQPSFYMNGAIDDVRVYNRAISLAEAQALHNSIV